MDDDEDGASEAPQRLEEVDWALIDEVLRDVPEEFKSERFYSLKHVIEIFSSGDPQERTAEVGGG